MEFNIDTNGNQRQMNLKGRLTFSDHELFREITGSLKEPGPSACQINLSGLEFIDSAGLGLLLLVSETAKEKNISISLSGARDQVSKMLEITKFSEVIPIH
jgi:HptB-dependent secretion and biofilm anti anti-sigma factor